MMDKTAIKNFAVWARVRLMEDTRTRLGLLGIKEDGISDPLPASTSEVKYFDIGADHPVSIKGTAIHQREQLAKEIREAAKEGSYTSAYQNFIEASAYDWFNRLIAIRYMEVNEYEPLDVRLLSSMEPGKQDPDLVSTPFDGSLEFTESDIQQILGWKEQHDNNRLFRFLLFKMCNQLHEILPGIFEARDDASELLMQQSFIDKDGIIHHLVTDIPEEDWKDQVQIIGWIYQYYNSELKAEVFAKKGKVTKDELPVVTQLFTPDWIVRYMVENSLGRLWIEHLRGLSPRIDEKATAEKFGWKYYLPEAKQDPEVEQQLAKIREEHTNLKPEDLSCMDPCMGSGHILVYMFDVLEQIYTSVGYSEREAAKAILENNIYGLDIDDRAYQLAYFAVLMKARLYNRRILSSGIKAHVYSIQESNKITKEQLRELGVNLNSEEKSVALLQAEKLIDLFRDAKEYGSILNIPEMDWDLLRRFAEQNTDDITLFNWKDEASATLQQLINQGEVMANKYWVVCTNPPYMSISNASDKLSEFVRNNYKNNKVDMFSAFMERTISLCNNNGYSSLITQQTWMFISGFDGTRKMLQPYKINSLLHLGTRAFPDISGEVVQSVAYCLCKAKVLNYKTNFIKLDDTDNKDQFFYEERRHYVQNKDGFEDLPGGIYAYWLSYPIVHSFKEHVSVEKIANGLIGLQTGDNARFLRMWFEIDINKLSMEDVTDEKYWVPYNKAGRFRRWYGNNDYVLNWENDGYDIINFFDEKGRQKSRPQNRGFYFREGISWSDVCTGKFSMRLMPQGFVFDSCAPTIFCDEKKEKYLLALYNTVVAQKYLDFLAPTIHYTCGSVLKLPYIESKKIDLSIIDSCVQITREDWDSFETSWDFLTHPLVAHKTGTSYSDIPMNQWRYRISDAYHSWEMDAQARFDLLKRNEEELNRIFIDIYGLQDELKPEEEDKDVTVRKADPGRDIRSLVSYIVGCIFGRYSLDKEGLIYAGGDWKAIQGVYKTFLPDKDNVIPITDQKYLDDDVVERICEFLTVVYGADTLEENLDFIAKALGNNGLTSREVIRNYMLNNFFKDHCKTYSVSGSGKRPIYWLFDSGKENAFKALVYMHRWDADTTGRVLLYAQQIQQKYETEIRAIDMMLDHITDSRQANTEEKRREHLKKQLEELVDYEERLEHMANERIAIDLDDGVKVNYEKVQTDRNGKKYQILAPIK